MIMIMLQKIKYFIPFKIILIKFRIMNKTKQSYKSGKQLIPWHTIDR